MIATREEQKAEALARMAELKLMPNVIREFKKEDVVYLSEGGGFLYYLEDDEREMVSEYEEETGDLVYHVIKNQTEIGMMYTLLYVSQEENYWAEDRLMLKEMTPICRVINKTYPDCSESGSVWIRPRIGGLVRVA